MEHIDSGLIGKGDVIQRNPMGEAALNGLAAPAGVLFQGIGKLSDECQGCFSVGQQGGHLGDGIDDEIHQVDKD